LLQEVIIPSQKGTKWGWHKLGQRKADICSIVSLAVSLQLQNGTCTGARLALGAVAPMPFLAKGASALVADKRLDAALIEKVAGAAAAEISPIDDVRATAWYRRRATKALVKQVLERIAG
jgi:CO/xanthine dehydrogenase FAD-binding subunit